MEWGFATGSNRTEWMDVHRTFHQQTSHSWERCQKVLEQKGLPVPQKFWTTITLAKPFFSQPTLRCHPAIVMWKSLPGYRSHTKESCNKTFTLHNPSSTGLPPIRPRPICLCLPSRGTRKQGSSSLNMEL